MSKDFDAYIAACEASGELTPGDRRELQAILGLPAVRRVLFLGLQEMNGLAFSLANIDLGVDLNKATRTQGKISGMNRFLEMLHSEAFKSEENPDG